MRHNELHNKLAYTITCIRCGKEEKAKRSNKKYCGDPEEFGTCAFEVRKEANRRQYEKRKNKRS